MKIPRRKAKKEESVKSIPDRKTGVGEKKLIGITITRLKSKLLLRAIVVNILTIGLLVATLVILGKLPSLGNKIKDMRTANLSKIESADVAVLQANISQNQGKISELEDLFADEQSILDFINQIDILKREGVISKFSFESNDIIRDKTNNFGLKIFIEYRGEPPRVNAALKKLGELNYLIRIESAELVKTNDETGTIILRHRGILYVNENISQN